MRYGAAASILVISALLAGCGGGGATSSTALQPQVFDSVQAESRPSLGGSAYADFQVAPKMPKAGPSRAAVKLTYLMSDDEGHQSPQSLGMLQLLDELPQRNVHNVVFRDGHDQGDSRIYYLTGGDKNQQTIGSAQSNLAPGVTEVQSNNSKVFSQIIGWTFGSYEGRRKYLQIYTHGGGVFGIGMDANQTDPKGQPLAANQQVELLTVPQFAESIKQGMKGRQLDLIYFRSCLMGNVEALYELRGSTHYALASEDVSYSVDNSNLTMTKMFDDLAARDTEPAELARQMAIQAHAKHPTNKDGDVVSGYYTFAAIDITRMDELKSSINVLARALLAALPGERAAITSAYDAVNTYSEDKTMPGYVDYGMRDLWAFTAELMRRVNSTGIRQAVDQVRAAQRSAMIHEKDAYFSDANGLSIFMPPRQSLAQDDNTKKFFAGGYLQTRFAQDTAWPQLLKALAS